MTSNAELQTGGFSPRVGEHQWPRLMRAETAARYVDDVSVRSFLRSVGTIYPRPITIPGKGRRWLRDELDRSIEQLTCKSIRTVDAADLL